jgi:hypothetical protein
MDSFFKIEEYRLLGCEAMLFPKIGSFKSH